MGSLKEIRTRMNSVKTTRQVTSAMKMVSAAKLRRAQEAIIRIRPYADKLSEILTNLSGSIDNIEENPFADDRGVARILIISINSNRGLCGAFNGNVNKKAAAFISENYSEQLELGSLDILAIGKNTYDYFRKRGYSVTEKNDLLDNLTFDNVAPVAEEIMKEFISDKYDKVYIVYNQFKNAASQNLVVEQFLPVQQESGEQEEVTADYIFEPSQEQIVDELIPNSLKIQFYKALLDSNAAEHGARMTAMHQATDNATDLLRELGRQYNKARQATITNEILDIVNGAEALNG